MTKKTEQSKPKKLKARVVKVKPVETPKTSLNISKAAKITGRFSFKTFTDFLNANFSLIILLVMAFVLGFISGSLWRENKILKSADGGTKTNTTATTAAAQKKLEGIEEKTIDLFANFRENMANYLSIGDEKINNQETLNEEIRPIYSETEKKTGDDQYSFEMELVGYDKNNEFQLNRIQECMEVLEKNGELTMTKNEFTDYCSPEQGELGSKLRPLS